MYINVSSQNVNSTKASAKVLKKLNNGADKQKFWSQMFVICCVQIYELKSDGK